MQQLIPTTLILEASGVLELPLVAAHAAASLPAVVVVVVVNPRQVRDFAKAIGRLAKTDSHRVTTPLTSVKVYNCLPLPKRLPRGGLFTPDDPITVRNTCALKAG